MPHAPDLAPLLTPIVALVVYAVRRALPWLRRRLPDWAVPLLATALGALAAHLGLDASPIEGAAYGLAASGAWSAGQQVARARRLRRRVPDGFACAHCGRRTHLADTVTVTRSETPAP